MLFNSNILSEDIWIPLIPSHMSEAGFVPSHSSTSPNPDTTLASHGEILKHLNKAILRSLNGRQKQNTLESFWICGSNPKESNGGKKRLQHLLAHVQPNSVFPLTNSWIYTHCKPTFYNITNRYVDCFTVNCQHDKLS